MATKTKQHATDEIERSYVARGFKHIAGTDEAGRGPLAGPVVASTVILPVKMSSTARNELSGLNDSKKLSVAKREQLFDAIHKHAGCISIASISAETIDELNILQASMTAMRLATLALPQLPDVLLVDGNRVPSSMPAQIRCEAIVSGDAKSISIAAASIIAKVTRDRMMANLDALNPHYHFAQNAGYGTAKHREIIGANGGLKGVHRFSFRPLNQEKLL
ncbi:MAG: ribonuclease HII [Pseudomonadota bacterium]